MLKINQVSLIPNPVACEAELVISVKIITWDSLNRDYTWKSLNESGETWDSLREKAVDMDYAVDSWDEANKRYTWNSLKRYPVSWGELKGE